MEKKTVFIKTVTYHSVEVEADSYEDAIDAAMSLTKDDWTLVWDDQDIEVKGE